MRHWLALSVLLEVDHPSDVIDIKLELHIVKYRKQPNNENILDSLAADSLFEL